jgi:hypothetical protein
MGNWGRGRGVQVPTARTLRWPVACPPSSLSLPHYCTCIRGSREREREWELKQA